MRLVWAGVNDGVVPADAFEQLAGSFLAQHRVEAGQEAGLGRIVGHAAAKERIAEGGPLPRGILLWLQTGVVGNPVLAPEPGNPSVLPVDEGAVLRQDRRDRGRRI